MFFMQYEEQALFDTFKVRIMEKVTNSKWPGPTLRNLVYDIV